jgi:tetratricopeptide (TPR) repeat protein
MKRTRVSRRQNGSQERPPPTDRRAQPKITQQPKSITQSRFADHLAEANSPWFTLGVCVTLTGLVWAVFGQTLWHDFINYDDPRYVYENAQITGGITLRSVAWAFTHVHAMNWHPLTTISHMLDCQLYGLQAGWHHFTNVLLHAAAAILLFLALQKMTRATWRSAFVAALFAIHPLRVESVAWIAERKDVLSGVFFMLILLAYTHYARKPCLNRYVLVSVLFACGLMAKPMLVTVPFVLLLLDYWPLRRDWRHVWRLIGEKTPLIALAGASSIVTFFVQKGAVGDTDQLPVITRFNNAIVTYVIYLRQMFWPANLAVFYPHPENHLPHWELALSAALLVGISLAALWLRERRPYLFVGWLWYLGMLVPVIGLVQVGWQGHADRYTYLPQIGLYIAISWTIADVTLRWRQRRRMVLTAAAAAVIFLLGWQAWIQTTYWRNSETLFTRALAVVRDNDVAENNLGIVRLQQGRLDEAIALLQAAVNLRPDNSPAQENLAKALLQKGRVDAALIHYRKLMDLQPENIEVHNIVGTVLVQRGWLKAGMEEWEKVLAIQPDNGNALNNLAWVLATAPDDSVRDGAKAVQLAERAMHISGGRVPLVFRTLAAAYAENGRFADAVQTAKRGIEVANNQGNFGLAAELQESITNYEAGRPLRDPSLGHANPSPPQE